MISSLLLLALSIVVDVVAVALSDIRRAGKLYVLWCRLGMNAKHELQIMLFRASVDFKSFI